MDISVITPSLNMLDYLKRCHASVADQEGAVFEHIVMDGCSSDGTPEWLRSRPDLMSSVERDRGMYDAINKGLQRARGEVLSYLNCDEQYLTGTLQFVKEFFQQRPDVDVLAGDTLLIRPDGSLISYRKAYPLPLTLLQAGHLQLHSSSLFFRRHIIDSGIMFNPNLKEVGDDDFVTRLIRKKYRFAYCRRYLSVFTMTGANRGMSPHAIDEGRAYTPAWLLTFSLPLRVLRWVIKLTYGAYFEHMPIVYSVYGPGDVDSRWAYIASRASFRWLPG